MLSWPASLLGDFLLRLGLRGGENWLTALISKTKDRKKFAEVCQQMPELIAAIREDLSNEEHVRDFNVVPHGARRNGSTTPAFVYTDTPEGLILGRVGILENYGYVREITQGSLPKYRMSEEFVALVRATESGASDAVAASSGKLK